MTCDGFIAYDFAGDISLSFSLLFLFFVCLKPILSLFLSISWGGV